MTQYMTREDSVDGWISDFRTNVAHQICCDPRLILLAHGMDILQARL
jgi:hypothetical protein